MADAAYDDADYLRDFIADGLDAPARIKQNPTRTARKTIEWALYRERHLVECFVNRIKRFRRVFLRCEKTVLILAAIPLSRLRNGMACLNEDAGWGKQFP